MAAMSVIGIDFGNESCYVAVARAGGIETIANDYSLRATPSCVAFSDRNRILGVAAKNQTVTNMKNTIHGFKRLIGRSFNDPHVQDELKFLPYNIIENSDGSIGIKVKYLTEDKIFTPEQCTAMLLTKLRESSEIALGCKINDCVLSVPSFYTNAERKALLDAAKIAGLRILRLFNETTATALTYGIYKQDLPSPEEPPRNVVFVDCGHSSLQVFACAFHKEKLKIIASAADPYLGGRNIDYILAKYFCEDFKQKYKIEPETNPRAFLRLLTEVEKLKKQMSANSTKLPFGIECFMNDIDVKGDMNRTQMEELCADIFSKTEKTMVECLEKSKLSVENIHSVEIVGGSSRVPAIKALIEKVFQKPCSTTLNQDEAVARGCALQCAMLSPAVRVREFSVTDLQMYPVVMEWDLEDEPVDNMNTVEVYPQMHATPWSRVMSFFKKEPFMVQLYYKEDAHIPYPSKEIGKYQITGVKPDAENKAQKVKVKVRVNIDGVVSIANASMYVKHESTSADEAMEVENENKSLNNTEGSNAETNSQEAMDNEKETEETVVEDKKGGGEKKKVVTKCVDLPVIAITHGLTPEVLNLQTELEGKMIADDKLEKERIDARNCLEEYVYELRNKIGSEDEYALYINSEDTSKISTQLDEIENWLYEEGADVNKSVYVSKLEELKKIGEQIQKRKTDYEDKTKAFENLFCAIQIAQKKISLFKSGDERFTHFDAAEVRVLEDKVASATKWAENAQSLTNEFTDKTLDAPVSTPDIKNTMVTLNNDVNSTFAKSKPQKPKPAEKVNEEPVQNGNSEPMDESVPKESEVEKGDKPE